MAFDGSTLTRQIAEGDCVCHDVWDWQALWSDFWFEIALACACAVNVQVWKDRFLRSGVIFGPSPVERLLVMKHRSVGISTETALRYNWQARCPADPPHAACVLCGGSGYVEALE